MKLSIILGTRPEIIKMSPIIRECSAKCLEFIIIHSGQHYSYNMDKVFFNQLKLPNLNYNLNIGSAPHGEMTGRIMIELEKALSQESPDIVLVEGDTNTVLAGAIVAVKMGIKVGHVEAGLRSYDRTMPEEINRVLVDHCSDMLFAPTEKSKLILIEEGINMDKIFVTGNTIVDAVYQNLKLAEKERNILDDLGVRKKEYFLVTVHRQENVDNKKRLTDILLGLEKVSKKYGQPIIYPIHPRARDRMKRFKLKVQTLRLIEPLDYLKFLQLMKNARLVLTDSGGIQEETCILGVPCVTLRYNTERPETLAVGSNILAGTDPENIIEKVGLMLQKLTNWDHPYGNGHAAERIINIILEKCS